MNRYQPTFICKECGAYNHLETKIIGEGYEGGVEYIKYEVKKHYKIREYPTWQQEIWIRSQNFKYDILPLFGKCEIELYLCKRLKELLLSGLDVSELFHISICCEGVCISKEDITKVLVTKIFDIVTENNTEAYLEVRYESLMNMKHK